MINEDLRQSDIPSLDIIQDFQLIENQPSHVAIFPLIDVIINSNIEHLTLYAFSTENWNRPKSEVDGLMGLLEEAIMKETDSVHEKNIKINYIGNTKRLSPNLQKLINNS